MVKLSRHRRSLNRESAPISTPQTFFLLPQSNQLSKELEDDDHD